MQEEGYYIAMVIHSIPFLRGLHIPIIHSDMCHSNPMKFEIRRKISIKTEKLTGFQNVKSCLTILKYRVGIYNVEIYPLFLTRTKKGGISKDN